MLIISQKKDAIFTLNNIDSLFIDKNYIQIATSDTTGVIAEYKSKERCVEVLCQIVTRYALTELLKCEHDNIKRRQILEKIENTPFVYELPLE